MNTSNQRVFIFFCFRKPKAGNQTITCTLTETSSPDYSGIFPANPSLCSICVICNCYFVKIAKFQIIKLSILKAAHNKAVGLIVGVHGAVAAGEEQVVPEGTAVLGTTPGEAECTSAEQAASTVVEVASGMEL